MDNTFTSLVASAHSILILLSQNPDFDQTAAGLSLYLSLMGVKETAISSPAPMTVDFNRLIGVNRVSQELGNKNLTIKFINYPAENIERVAADVDNSEFKLTVIPKGGFPSPQKEQVNLSFSGVVADLVILIGGESESDFPAIATADLTGAKLIHIGVRSLTVSQDRNLMSFVKPASSISELAAIVIKESGFTLDADIATNLLSGIEEGGNHFTGGDVTADTFEIYASLLRVGGHRIPKDGFVKKTYPPGAIPGQIPPAPVPNTVQVANEQVVTTPPAEEQTMEPAPKDWFEPKIYKGTSLS